MPVSNHLHRETRQFPVAADMPELPHVMTRDRVHVMLVEDSPLIRQALTEALDGSGVALFDGFASTSQEAIALLHARRYDMVVVDIELQHGTGFDVLQEINKPDFPYPAPMAIVLTNHAYVVYRHRAQALGVKYFFDKSMHFDEAIETLEREAEAIMRAQSDQ